ncbi:MAG: prolipoprotein diacylglyceryl transferase [SAR202 cluster bacterium]|nr:prolipoprotein diacylglyceryl transferase [SAR202 cluster bacterium]|tara:strand:+ start:1128 stop:1988 length:861 start_codon:yes stop_codon:yes gene_type:complete
MIEIGIGPNIIDSGSFVLSWHGFLSFVAVIVAVLLTARLAPRHGISTDDVYAVATWGILGGVIGARLLHVIDEADFYWDNPDKIIQVWNGGIAVWGGVLGGLAGAWIYASRVGIVRGRLADITAPGLLLAMAIGRIGDIINGEHLAEASDLPWAFVWTHTSSVSYQSHLDPITGVIAGSHPAVVYEGMLDLAIVALALWVLPKLMRPDGMVFAASLGLYALGRVFILIAHDYDTWFLGLNEAQVVSILVLMAVVPILVVKGKFGKFDAPEPLEMRKETRSVRRRQH